MFEEYEENILFNSPKNEWRTGEVICWTCVELHTGWWWMSQWSCGEGLGSHIQEELTCRLKMQVGVWLLCMSWFCTWVEYSHTCNCQDISKEPELSKRSKTRVKEHVHDSVGHHHGPHRNRPHRRKGEPRAYFHTGGMHQWCAATCSTSAEVLSCKTGAIRCKGVYRTITGLQLHSYKYYKHDALCVKK